MGLYGVVSLLIQTHQVNMMFIVHLLRSEGDHAWKQSTN